MDTNYTSLFDTSNLASQPEPIKTKLKPHQLALVYRANFLESNTEIKSDPLQQNTEEYFDTKIGIIGDKVGSGKTLSILSIICSNKYVKRKKISYFNGTNYVNLKTIHPSSKYLPMNIIVVPHTIVKQWESTINQQTDLSYCVIYNKKSLDKIVQTFGIDTANYSNNFDIEKVIAEVSKYDIFLVSSTFYNKFAELSIFYNTEISRLIFDEADSIKIASCREINANFYWFVSSTFENLIYPRGKRYFVNTNTNEIQPYSYYNTDPNLKLCYIEGITKTGFIKNAMTGISCLQKNILKEIILKNDDNFIRNSFMLSQPVDNYIICEYPPNMNIIKDVISTDVLNMLNAGNIKGAIEKMDCTKVNDENNLIKVVTNDLERNLENAKIEFEMKSKLHYSCKKVKETALEKLSEKIVELQSKIDHVKNKLVEKSACPICYDTVNNKTITKCCNTSYCLECISYWLAQNDSCPFCRHKLTFNDLIIMDDCCKDQTQEEVKVLRNKLFYLKKFFEQKLSSNSKFKVLIFSDYYESFDEVSELLNSQSIKYSKIMGSHSTISKTIENYKNGDINVLLLNSNFSGSGLNLENSTDVLIYHSMNNEKDKQVIGRAQRPGRTERLNILRLCYENEESHVKKISNKIEIQ